MCRGWCFSGLQEDGELDFNSCSSSVSSHVRTPVLDIDDEVETGSAIENRGLPEGVPAPEYPRWRKAGLSSAYNKACPEQCGLAGCSAPKERNSSPDVGQHSSESSEDFSDISEDSDIFNLCVEPKKGWTTEQDVDLTNVQYIAGLLRDDPLAPADPEDVNAELDWKDVQSGAALPRAHCAFRGFEQSHLHISRDVLQVAC